VYRTIEAWDIQAKALEHLPSSEQITVGDIDLMLYSHDWRAVPLRVWLSRQDSDVLSSRPSEAAQRAHPILPRAEFDAAVRAGLRHIGHDAALDANTLCGSGVVHAAQELRILLTEAVQTLADDPRAAKQHRAVYTTYFLSVPTQEAAAERLDLPFSTYRRHLASGTERICEALWNRHLHAHTLSNRWARLAAEAKPDIY